MELKDKVTCIKGIGEKTAGNLAKLGISTVSDLIHYYPRTYITYMDPVDIQDIQADERQAVSVTINSRVEVKKLRGFSIATAYAKDYTGTIKLTWFNCPFLRNYFHIGDRYIFVGEVKYKNGMYTMSQPEYYTVPKYQEILKEFQAALSDFVLFHSLGKVHCDPSAPQQRDQEVLNKQAEELKAFIRSQW